MTNVTAGPKVIGHCLIKDADTGEVLVDKDNAINFEVFSYALALSLADRPNGSIQQIVFGNGASSVSATGEITYQAPNTTGLTATLYNQTYAKFINDQSTLDTDPTNNYISVNHTTNTTYSDVVVTCTLDYSEPSGQMAFDNSTITNGEYIFDEIGLTTYNTSTQQANLLSHVIFHPVQKALDRKIIVIYTLRIVMS